MRTGTAVLSCPPSVYPSSVLSCPPSLSLSVRWPPQVKEMGWGDVTGWVPQGGALLGTKRTLPQKYMSTVAARFKEHKIQVGTGGSPERAASVVERQQLVTPRRSEEFQL